MDLLDSLNILMKRWLLTVPLFVLTVGAVVAASVVLPWEYEAQATMVFLASPVQAKNAGGNPWLVFDGSLTVTAEVVGREMMDDRTVAQLRAKGLTAGYKVEIAPNSTGPVLSVDVTGDNAANTVGTMNAILAMIPDRLAQIQAAAGVAPAARITVNMVSVTPQPQKKSTKKLRTVAVVLFGGFSLTVVAPLFLESVSVRRRVRAPGGGAAKQPADEIRIGPGPVPSRPREDRSAYARIPDRSGDDDADSAL